MFFGQDVINSEYNRRANKIVSNDEENEELFFEEILNLYNIPENLQYKIKWLYFHRLIWKLVVNVQGCDNDIVVFYAKYFKKPGSPV